MRRQCRDPTVRKTEKTPRGCDVMEFEERIKEKPAKKDKFDYIRYAPIIFAFVYTYLLVTFQDFMMRTGTAMIFVGVGVLTLFPAYRICKYALAERTLLTYIFIIVQMSMPVMVIGAGIWWYLYFPN